MKLREEAVVHSSKTTPLLHAYERRGYGVEREFFEPHRIELAREEAYALRCNYTGEGIFPEKNVDTTRLICGVQTVHPRLVDLLVTPKLVALAESILGSGVYIHQFRLHYKSAFWGSDFFWHSDFSIWHWQDGMMDPRCVHFSIPLEEMRPENGPLMVSPGTHMFHDETIWDKRKQDGRSIRQERDHPARLKNGFVTEDQLKLVESYGVQTITGKPGDLSFHDVNLLHASGPNFSPWGRLTAFIAINSMDNKLQDPPNGKPARANWVSSREYNKL
jgi:ectoine hydroxylase